MGRIHLNEALNVLIKLKINNTMKETKQVLSEEEYEQVFPKLLELGWIRACEENKKYHYINIYNYRSIYNLSKQVENFMENLKLSYELTNLEKALNNSEEKLD